MKVCFLFLILILVSCAQKPLRQPATIDTEFFFGEVDREKSMVKLFPSVSYNGQFQYYFFLQLKNKVGRYIDIEEKDIQILTDNKEKISFELKRQLRGRYYIQVQTSEEISQKTLDFFVNGISLKEKFQLNIAPVDKKMSKVKVLWKKGHKARFQLFLADKKGVGVEIPELPELIIEPGNSGEIEDLVHIKAGVWEFTMTYPEQNIVIYINVRVLDTYLEHLYRFQHVEK